MKKVILIIGAGIGQVHIVKLSQQLGCHVIVVSPKGNYPAIDLADEFFDCDIYDRDKIVDYARDRNIDAVTSDQNDLMMPTVAYVAEALGLPGNTFEQVMSYCDKNMFRKICKDANVPVPANVEISNSDIPLSFNVPLPWIVKPSDSQSSIGISKINNIEEYQEAVKLAISKSKQHKAILEKFFTGTEYVCEGFIYYGKYYNIAFGDRMYFKDSLIPSQTIFPSTLSQSIKDRIVECESRIASTINTNFGIVHSEYLVNDETGDFCIVESAIRGGGVYISSHLIPLSTGFDINTLLLKCALGEKIDVENCFANPDTKVSAYMCFTLPGGIITEVQGIEEIAKIEGVKMFDIRDLGIGTKTEKMTVKGARKGPILIQAKDREELHEIEQRIKDTISIKVNGHINNSIIW